jgi:hypothetical protein
MALLGSLHDGLGPGEFVPVVLGVYKAALYAPSSGGDGGGGEGRLPGC